LLANVGAAVPPRTCRLGGWPPPAFEVVLDLARLWAQHLSRDFQRHTNEEGGMAASSLERWDATDQISRLMFRYAECMDQADFAGVGKLFADGVWHNNRDIGQHLSGDAVTSWLEENVKVHGDALATRHCTTNLIVDVADDGETATARSYVFLFQVLDGFPLQPIFLGRYHDTFRQIDGRWLFKDRVIMGDGVGDLSQHVLAGVLPGEEA
jgi:hypothetical protein